MKNPLRELVRIHDITGAQIAKQTGLSRAMVYRAIRRYEDDHLGIPPEVKVNTIIKIAEYLEHEARFKFQPITLEPIEESGNGK